MLTKIMFPSAMSILYRSKAAEFHSLLTTLLNLNAAAILDLFSTIKAFSIVTRTFRLCLCPALPTEYCD